MARLGIRTINRMHQPLPQPYNDAGEGPAVLPVVARPNLYQPLTLHRVASR